MSDDTIILPDVVPRAASQNGDTQLSDIVTRLDRMDATLQHTNKRLSDIEEILTDVPSSSDVYRKLEIDRRCDEAEQRQHRHIENVLNKVGSTFEDTVNGLISQISTLTDRVQDVTKINGNTARIANETAILSKQNASAIQAWGTIHQTAQAQLSPF
jgi:DNA repair ATPase RecN